MTQHVVLCRNMSHGDRLDIEKYPIYTLHNTSKGWESQRYSSLCTSKGSTMFGDIFEKLTGKKPDEFESLIDIEQAIEKATQTTLEFKKFDSDMVHSRGNIFVYSNRQRDLDAELDAALR